MQYFDKVVYTFSADNEPTGTIDSGEIVIFRTQDCFSNQMHSESQLVTSCDYSKMNPATGPLFVRDAQPGDVIKVELLDVQCDTIGTTTTLPKIGPLWDKCETRTKRIPIENGKAVFNDVTFPINPMIGVIGVAPEKGKSVPCGYPGSHGGNMDNTAITTGATLYFPVAVEGALFGCGDMHAAMGDGEISVSGAEVAGYATVTLTALPDLHLVDPLIENGTHLGIIASAESLDAAADRAVHEMVDLLHDRTGVDEAELVMLLSLVADVQVCQMVDPQKTVRFMVPKYVLESLGFKL